MSSRAISINRFDIRLVAPATINNQYIRYWGYIWFQRYDSYLFWNLFVNITLLVLQFSTIYPLNKIIFTKVWLCLGIKLKTLRTVKHCMLLFSKNASCWNRKGSSLNSYSVNLFLCTTIDYRHIHTLVRT